jgi:hypothetical protein
VKRILRAASHPLWLEQTPVKVAITCLGNCPDLDPVRRYVSLLPSQTVLMTNGTRGVSLAAEAAAKGQGIAINVLPLAFYSDSPILPTPLKDLRFEI